MPELPEVETVVRSIEPFIKGQRILRAEVRSRRVTRQPFDETEAGLKNAIIRGIERRGKQIFVQLDRGTLYVHLGMTGRLLWQVPETKFTRAFLEFDTGTLVFDDIRQFGRFEFFADVSAMMEAKGPDALTIDLATFTSRLQRYRGPIKAVLLNQSFVSGIGNIYADEILFAARVHPRTRVGRLSKRRVGLLHEHTLRILRAAVQLGGSSISNYVDGEGRRGAFQTKHLVYGRTGGACTVCGTPIRRIVTGQRGTHYCPQCQRV